MQDGKGVFGPIKSSRAVTSTEGWTLCSGCQGEPCDPADWSAWENGCWEEAFREKSLNSKTWANVFHESPGNTCKSDDGMQLDA